MPILLRLPAAALILSLGAAQHFSVESRTLAPTVPAREGVRLIMNQRIVSDGTVLLISRGVQPDGSVYYDEREFRLDGTPVAFAQEGFWASRWNRFETRFSSKSAEQHINETTNRTSTPAQTFRDPTVL